MKTAIRILLILVMLEAVVAVAVLGRIAWRTAAQTPDVSVSDPLIMPHLRRLARQAEFGDAKAWTRLGEALLGKGFYAHAELAFREALRRDSQDFAAQFGLAFCLDRTGRTQESDPEYQKALRLSTDGLRPGHPGKAETLYAMGRNALRRENLINAEDLFRQNAGYPPADYQLAKLLIRSDRAEEALPLIEQYLEKLPLSLEFQFLRMRAAQALNQPESAFAAEAMLERSAPLVSLNFSTDYIAPLERSFGVSAQVQELSDLSRGEDYAEIEKRCDAIESVLEGRAVYAASIIDLLRVDVAVRARQPERALQICAKLRGEGRESGLMLELEGDAYALLDANDRRAAERWLRALRVAPHAGLHRKLADYYSERDSSQRDSHLGRAALLDGIAAYRGNQLPAAAEFFREATQLTPQDPEPWFYWGEVNFFQEEREKAAQNYRECLKRDSGHVRAAAKLQKIDGN